MRHEARHFVVASLAVCLGTAVLSGFVFWGGAGARSPASSLAGATPPAGTTAAPVTTVPPLAVPCNAKINLPLSKALFRISGRCTLDTDGPAQCDASGGDDYGAVYAMKTTRGDAAYFSLSIEGYTKPGLYKSANVLFFVLHGNDLAQWQAPSAAITIAAHSVIVPTTVLKAAPGTGATSTLTAQGTLPCTLG